MCGNYFARCLLLIVALSLNGWAQPVEGVKYRGIFINDEDWGLRPWAVKHFGKKEQIGTNAYVEIFALMKKNNLNLIWPAMHEGGYEFSSRSENFDLAAKEGIIVGTSHCEPMLRNNCYLSKSDKKKWSWVNNRAFLEEYWREGVRRGMGNGEQGTGILWTIGMRGIHDGRMPDGKTTPEKRKILEEVFAAQCAMLPKDAPKLFVPYKEVLPIFNSGMNVPEDAIIMWTNDNFGYVRRVGDNHGIHGKQGIYWHISYYGHPHGYNHLCATPPAFMWYELVAKCWENGVRDVWMVNAGDVFQAEILLDAYGKFAANPEAWGVDAQPKFLDAWGEGFVSRRGAEAQRRVANLALHPCDSAALRDRISKHLAEYYNLGFNRKPEHMCIQWTTNLPAAVKSSLLKRFHALLEEDDAIECEIRKLFTNDNCHNCSQIAKTNSTRSTCSTRLKESATRLKDDYFRLIGFQVRFLAHAGIIHLEGRDKAYARSVIDPLYERWDRMDGGKWAGFWCDTIDEHGGARQLTMHNRWSSQMQWSWNEPADPAKKDRHGRSRNDYAATVYRADIAEPTWIEPAKRERGTGNGEWKEVPGLGTSGNALALLPVKPGVGAGATLEYDLNMRHETRDASIPHSPFPVPRSLILQFLPDFALWPGLKLGVDVVFNGCEPKFVEVPCSNSNLGEHDRIRNQAVQDNFIRVEIPVPAGATSFKIVAKDPGVVIDRIGIRK